MTYFTVYARADANYSEYGYTQFASRWDARSYAQYRADLTHKVQIIEDEISRETVFPSK